MDILILIFLLLTIIGAISFIILKLFFNNKIAEIIFNATLAGYLAFAVAISFRPDLDAITAVESAAFYCLLGIWAVIMWRIIEGKRDIKIWVWSWIALGAAYCIIQLVKYGSDPVIRNLVDFGAQFMVLFYIITIASLAKKNKYAGVFSKATAVLYIIIAILFSILPPNDPATIISSLIVAILLAVVPGAVLLILYKKRYMKIDKVKEMLDEI